MAEKQECGDKMMMMMKEEEEEVVRDCPEGTERRK